MHTTTHTACTICQRLLREARVLAKIIGSREATTVETRKNTTHSATWDRATVITVTLADGTAFTISDDTITDTTAPDHLVRVTGFRSKPEEDDYVYSYGVAALHSNPNSLLGRYLTATNGHGEHTTYPRPVTTITLTPDPSTTS